MNSSWHSVSWKLYSFFIPGVIDNEVVSDGCDVPKFDPFKRAAWKNRMRICNWSLTDWRRFGTELGRNLTC